MRKGDGCLGASGLAKGVRGPVPNGPFLGPAIVGRDEGPALVVGAARWGLIGEVVGKGTADIEGGAVNGFVPPFAEPEGIGMAESPTSLFLLLLGAASPGVSDAWSKRSRVGVRCGSRATVPPMRRGDCPTPVYKPRLRRFLAGEGLVAAGVGGGKRRGLLGEAARSDGCLKVSSRAADGTLAVTSI